jgi:hypothetical protein
MFEILEIFSWSIIAMSADKLPIDEIIGWSMFID